ncbi:MAG: polyketide synthase, partial [Thermoanaerobaculia bacterium]
MEARNGLEIAIIGMACRVPGADTPQEFWHLLRDGVDAITRLSDEVLRAAGVPSHLLDDPSYVKAAGIVEGEDLFDARLFGLSPREAELLDPQHRLFLECAWTALEDAGYPPRGGNVGVYAGAYFSCYSENNIQTRPDILAAFDISQRRLASGREFLTTRVAH